MSPHSSAPRLTVAPWSDTPETAPLGRPAAAQSSAPPSASLDPDSQRSGSQQAGSQHSGSQHAGAQDAVWRDLRAAAADLARREPVMTTLAHMTVLDHARFEDALSYRLAQKLASPELSALFIRDLSSEALSADPEIGRAAREDIAAVYERDPACTSYLEPLLFFKGYLALQASRISHWFWTLDRRELARVLQMRGSEVFGVDIHPGASIGRGLMIDHATGVVVGETAVIGDDVSMLHGVTLGGTGKESGDRHPKIGRNVLIGAGASILGNITIGECSRVGAGSVVLDSVPACKTVAGVPARIVGDSGCSEPSRRMDHHIEL